MCSLESLKIDLKGLKEGVTALEYDLGDAYFGGDRRFRSKQG